MDLTNTKSDWFVWDDEANKPGYKSRAHQIAEGFYTPEKRKEQWAGIDWLPGEVGETVLDVACGNGNYCKFFLDRGMEYTGCDLSENMLEQARENNPGVEFVRGDATKLPFEDDQFDMVFCSDLLIHLPKRIEKRVVRELLRVARKYVALHQRVVCRPPAFFEQLADGTIHRYEVMDDELKRMVSVHHNVKMHIRNYRNVAGFEGADVFYIFTVGD